jgi:hypothetical protein
MDAKINANQEMMEARIEANKEQYVVLQDTLISQMNIQQARTVSTQK